MSNRFFGLAVFASGAALAAAGAIAFVALAPANAQTSSTAKSTKEGTKSWTPPRTPDGQPDIQGYFTNASATPLERPKDLGAMEFYTPEAAVAATKARLDQSSNLPTGPGTYSDVHYDDAQFGLEPNQSKVAPNMRTSLITGPEGRIPPMLPEARKKQAERAAMSKGHEFDGPENRPLSERCILMGTEGPPMMPIRYNSNLQIVQGKGYVAITQEMIHDTRIIPTDGSAHLPPEVRQLMGDSRGHWEGNTLVVDTTNFTDRTAFRGSSENLHVVERFTRTNPDTVTYQFTVSDPSTWEKSWSAEVPMTKIDGPLFEYACHEGNYGMRNNLTGARAEERQKAAAQTGLKP